jgi:hypothetical protein
VKLELASHLIITWILALVFEITTTGTDNGVFIEICIFSQILVKLELADHLMITWI